MDSHDSVATGLKKFLLTLQLQTQFGSSLFWAVLFITRILHWNQPLSRLIKTDYHNITSQKKSFAGEHKGHIGTEELSVILTCKIIILGFNMIMILKNTFVLEQ